jgi:hypothetical protein
MSGESYIVVECKTTGVYLVQETNSVDSAKRVYVLIEPGFKPRIFEFKTEALEEFELAVAYASQEF